MAKKKCEEAPRVDDCVDRVFDSITADFGTGVIVPGSETASVRKTVIPITPSLDIISSGGIAEGSFVGLNGIEKTGKTTLALQIAANAQKPEYGGRQVFFDDIEHRLTPMHLAGISGLNTKKPHFYHIKSIRGKILSAQEHLEICGRILKTVPGCVLIMDSISSLCDEREMAGGVGTETRGGGAKLFTQWLNMMASVVPTNDCILIGITHVISNTSGRGSPNQEKGARRWKYGCDYRFVTMYAPPWMAGDRQIGQKPVWQCKCSKLGPPGMKIESYLRYGTGMDGLYELIVLGSAAGLIKKSGAWLTLSFLERHPEVVGDWNEVTEKSVRAQGGENLYQLLKDRPELASALEKDVLAMAGGLASSGGEE